MMRKTKIVCTLGPATDDPEVLKALMNAGMNVGRINFSHGNYQDQEERINVFKWIRGELGLPIPLLLVPDFLEHIYIFLDEQLLV